MTSTKIKIRAILSLYRGILSVYDIVCNYIPRKLKEINLLCKKSRE